MSDLTAGAELAGYRIQQLVGRGGMGVVYRAEQLRLGRTVALKVLATPLAADEAFRERFERESRLAALIDHPNIVPIYEADEAAGLLFISMRWVEGRDLRDILVQEGRLDVDRALMLLEQIGSALDAAHERGLVHRDVKPANILISGSPPREHAYLTDFGIAKMASSGPFTRTGMFLGTPDYAAPEQFEGKELDGRADVYALGCLLYQCLAGTRPFERTQEVAVMYAHLHDPPPRVTAERPDLPPALDEVIAKAMAKRKHERFATCRELIDAARTAVGQARAPEATEGRPEDTATVAAAGAAVPTIQAAATPAARPEAPAERPRAAEPTAPPAPPPAAPPPAESRPAASRPRRLRWLAIAAAGAAVAGVVVALVVLTGGDGGEPSAAEDGAQATQTPTAGEETASEEDGESAIDTEADTTPSATQTAPAGTETVPSNSTPLAELTWSRVESANLSGEAPQELQRVAVGEGGAAVAAGSAGLAGERDAAFWTLGPAAEETPVERQVLEAEGDEVAFGIATTGGGEAVAVGYRQPAPPAGDTAAAVWLLRDGSWSAAGEELGAAPYEKMNRVAVGADGTIMAVGTAGPGRAPSGTPLATDAAAWLSRDGGLTWERTDEATLGGEGYLEMRGVTPFGDGFVAVGYHAKDAAAWRFDGGAWERAGAQSALTSGGGLLELDMRAVERFGEGLVAVGDIRRENGERDGAVWLSEDGLSWTLVRSPVFAGPGDQMVLGLAATETGIVAVGCSGCLPEETEAAVWTSPDGRTWERTEESLIVGTGPAQQTNDLASGSARLVGVGWDTATGLRSAAVWLAAPSG